MATRNLPTSTRNQKELNYVCVCVDEPRRRQSVLAIQIQEDVASLSGLQFRRACESLAEATALGFAPLAHGCCAMYDKRMDSLSVQHKMYTTVRWPFTSVKTNGGAV